MWFCSKILKILLLIIWILSLHTATFAVNDTILKKVRLQLKWKHQFQFAGYYAAIEKGFYKEAGLDVELIEVPETETPEELVLSNKAEFGISTTDILIWRAKGKPLVVMASVYQHSPMVLIASKNSNINNVHDLPGKRIMIEQNAAEILSYLSNEKVKIDLFKTVPHNFSVDDLIAGKVDAITAYTTDEPFVLQQKQFEFTIISPQSGGVDFYGDNLFTTEQLIKHQPAVVDNFLRASLKGWKYAMEHKEEIINIIYTKYSQRHTVQHLTFEANTLQHYIMHNVVEIGYTNTGRWENIINTYKNLGIIDKNFTSAGLFYADYKKPKIYVPWQWAWSVYLTIASIGLIAFFYFLYTKRLKNEVKQRKQIQLDLEKNQEMLRKANDEILQDITMQKRMEEMLRNSVVNFENIFNNALFPIMVASRANMYILQANKSASELFLLPKEKLSDIKISDLFNNKNEYEKLASIFQKKNQIINAEINAKDLRNNPFYVVLSARPVIINQRDCILITLFNISDRKKAEQDLQINEIKLKSLNATKDKFFSIIAHDLKNPFSSILLMSELIMENLNRYSEDELKELIVLINNSAQNGYKLLENLLAWARMQTGNVNFKPQKLSLNELFNETIESNMLQAIGKKITVQNHLSEPIYITADKNMLNTVLRNLISNAIKYTPKNGLIIINAVKTNAHTEISVTDNGVGMEPEIVENIFLINEKVSQPGTENETGTGLGLVLCKEFVEKHNGKIWAESKPGNGSVFKFTIPD